MLDQILPSRAGNIVTDCVLVVGDRGEHVIVGLYNSVGVLVVRQRV